MISLFLYLEDVYLGVSVSFHASFSYRQKESYFLHAGTMKLSDPTVLMK